MTQKNYSADERSGAAKSSSIRVLEKTMLRRGVENRDRAGVC